MHSDKLQQKPVANLKLISKPPSHKGNITNMVLRKQKVDENARTFMEATLEKIIENGKYLVEKLRKRDNFF